MDDDVMMMASISLGRETAVFVADGVTDTACETVGERYGLMCASLVTAQTYLCLLVDQLGFDPMTFLRLVYEGAREGFPDLLAEYQASIDDETADIASESGEQSGEC